MTDFDDLPPVPNYEAIVKIVGEEVAVRLSEDFGGIRLHIPINPGPHSPISVSIGLDAARKISEVYGSQYMSVPLNASKRAKVLALISKGWSAPKIARAARCSERYVKKLRSQLRDDQQLGLPLGDTGNPSPL